MAENEIVEVADFGGAGLRVATYCDGKLLNHRESNNISTAEEAVKFVASGLSPGTRGVSYAVAGLIGEKGVVLKSPNIRFLNGVPLARMTTDYTGLPTVVCNDMVGSVTGMPAFVSEVVGQCFWGLTGSSGFGGKYGDENGRVIFPKAEVGHIRIRHSPDAPFCACGRRGCVESIAGGKAVTRRVITETEARGIKIPEGVHPCEFLDQAFAAGDDWAVDIFRIVSDAFGDLLAILVTICHVKHIVWKGTFAKRVVPKAEDAIRARMCEGLIDSQWSHLNFHILPEVSGTPNADSFVGAARIFLERYP